MPAFDNELASIVAELNRAAPGTRAVAPDIPQGTATLDQLLAHAARRSASDLLLIAGSPVALRVDGKLTPAAGPALGADDTRNLLLPLLTPKQYQELQRNKSIDFCFSRESIGRFRANVHHQRGTLAGSVRLLPPRIPTLESLHLPPTLQRLAEARQGLVLITGSTGCGKSSTLAALIELINTERRDHIVTIEDPVEYVHGNRNSIVEQIEVGHDAPDFASSVRSIMRQTPDVILVGEMRDVETIGTVLTAAETGHLVLSTLHTNDTSQAISRILDSFPVGQPAADPAAALAGNAGHRRAATGAGGGSRRALSGGRNHDGNACGAQPDPQRRRSPDLHRHLNGPGGGNDDDGAIARGDGARRPHHARDRAGALFPARGSAAVFARLSRSAT